MFRPDLLSLEGLPCSGRLFRAFLEETGMELLKSLAVYLGPRRIVEPSPFIEISHDIHHMNPKRTRVLVGIATVVVDYRSPRKK